MKGCFFIKMFFVCLFFYLCVFLSNPAQKHTSLPTAVVAPVLLFFLSRRCVVVLVVFLSFLFFPLNFPRVYAFSLVF
jgi:hypothetical protein